ncbi:unnamed protein product [Brassica napus]|uniref:(rape) hypothetical protein n=1 Tax=Brassica napus TaxID=3708 RepID=A0A816SZL9_BRANA|nr:unnamed protein product [Brassica napus]
MFVYFVNSLARVQFGRASFDSGNMAQQCEVVTSGGSRLLWRWAQIYFQDSIDEA